MTIPIEEAVLYELGFTLRLWGTPELEEASGQSSEWKVLPESAVCASWLTLNACCAACANSSAETIKGAMAPSRNANSWGCTSGSRPKSTSYGSGHSRTARPESTCAWMIGHPGCHTIVALTPLSPNDRLMKLRSSPSTTNRGRAMCCLRTGTASSAFRLRRVMYTEKPSGGVLPARIHSSHSGRTLPSVGRSGSRCSPG